MPGGKRPIPVLLEGNERRKRTKDEFAKRVHAEESLKTTARLSCPKTLSPLGQKEWRRVMKLYRKMDADILNDLDVAALTMYCEAWAIYRAAQDEWRKYQKVASTNKTAQKLIDKIRTTMNEQTKVITALSEQLCLTPVGRARMGIGMAKHDNSSAVIDLLSGSDDGDDE